MTREDRMLQKVLNDVDLMKYYDYSPDDFRSVQDALNAEKPIIQAVAKIIRLIKNDDTSKQREVYLEVFNDLKNNLL